MKNTQYKYDLVIYIGRFQPFHNGHRAALDYASTLSENILVLIGSANGPRTTRNPWSYDERVASIKGTTNCNAQNLFFGPLNDYSYNDNKWIQQVGLEIDSVIKTIKNFDREVFRIINSGGKMRIAIIGHDKDHTSNYLNYFPQWDYIEMPAYPSESETIDSTRIRQLMFSNQVSFTDGVVPGSQVRDFMQAESFTQLQEEWNANEAYKDSWKAAPYDVNFTTVDAVVEQSGHILLIQRGRMPGKGLWAMPGGHLETTEKVVDGIIRELREETGLKIPEKVLRGSITHLDFFDDIERSLRGRTITFTALIQLDNAAALAKVKGCDDAMDARWFSLAEFEKMQDRTFEDHYSVIKNMLARA